MNSRVRRGVGQVGLIVVVLLAPLPFGAVLGWTAAALTTALALLVVLSAASGLIEDRPLSRPSRQVLMGAGLLSVPAALQLLPLPASIVRFISPSTASFYAMNSTTPRSWHPLTEDPAATWAALGWIMACAAAAFLVTNLFDRRSVRRLVVALIALGVGEAFYGLVEYLSGRNHIFFYERRFYLESATGTYINRNHFAGLLVLLIPLAAAWLLARLARRSSTRGQDFRTRLLALSDSRTSQTVLLALAMSVMGAALALSFSRAGVTIGALVLAATVFWNARDPERRRFRRSWAAPIWATVLVLIALVPLAIRGPGRLATLATDVPTELQAATGRPLVWAKTLRIAQDHPLTGTGLGTFGSVFRRYRPGDVRQTYTHAHQDYLQWLAETGVLGGAVGMLFLAGLARASVRAVGRSSGNVSRALAIGASAGLGGMALHGLVDFNGHIPANTLIATILCGIILILADKGTEKTGSMRHAARWQHALVLGGALLLTAGATQQFGREWTRTFVLHPLAASGGWQLAMVADGARDVSERAEAAARKIGDGPALLRGARVLAGLAGATGDPGVQARFQNSTLALARASLAATPGSAEAHLLAGAALTELGRDPEQARRHLRSAASLEPSRGELLARIGMVELATDDREAAVRNLKAAIAWAPYLAEELFTATADVAPPLKPEDITPHSPDGLMALGDWIEKGGDPVRAMPKYKQALRLATATPSSAAHSVLFRTYQRLAGAYFRQQGWEQVASLASRQLQAGQLPEPAQEALLHYHLGVARFRQGQMEQALDALVRACEVDPTRPLYADYRARTLEALDRPAEAATIWASTLAQPGRVTAAAGGEIPMRLRRVAALRTAGQLPEALRELRTILVKDPANTTARHMMETLGID